MHRSAVESSLQLSALNYGLGDTEVSSDGMRLELSQGLHSLIPVVIHIGSGRAWR